MRAFLIENGVAVQANAPDRPASDFGEGWVDGPEDVLCGYLFDGEVFSQPSPPPPTIGQVQQLMGQKLEALASGYEREERETWATQVKEADAIKAGSTTAPLLSSLAAGKGRTLDEQADRVLYLAQQFALASGAIMAARDALIALDPIPADYAADTYWP